MRKAQVIWDLPEDPNGNVQHIAEHELTQDDVEHVLLDTRSQTTISNRSGQPITFGETPTGRYIAVVWEHVADDPLTMRPITAYDVPRPRTRRGRP